MLDENQVIAFVKAELERRGYHIDHLSDTFRGRGPDIVATREGRRVYVEAKGEKSSKSWTARFLTGFDNGQMRDHYGKALLKAVELREEYPDARVCMAFPDLPRNRELMERTKGALALLRIGVLFANPEGNVEDPLGSLDSEN